MPKNIAELLTRSLSDEEVKMVESLKRQMAGEEVAESITMKEFLATPSAQILVPRVIVGTMREVAEPLYIGSKLLRKIRLKQGQSMIFPYMGVMQAHDVAEGQEIPEDTIDWAFMETPEVRIGKTGIRIRVTDELISDSQWDVVAMLIEQAGRAMARLKEQKCFNAFSKHGHTVFDNNIRAAQPEAGTTGLAYDGTFNNTMSVEDFLDLIIVVMANEYNPTDILMHPLSWTAFAKNGLLGSLGHAPESAANGNIPLGPGSIQGRLPFAFNVQLSPFIPIDKVNKTFDMYVVDKNNIGVLLVKQDLTTDQFDEPARDIRNIKTIERYGVGILNEGRAVAVAKNISLDKAYPEMVRVKNFPVQ